jgi:hypothetical protein
VGEVASLETCPCCAIQFGVDDVADGDLKEREKLYEVWEKKWSKSGRTWLGIGGHPEGWDPQEQLWWHYFKMGKNRDCIIDCLEHLSNREEQVRLWLLDGSSGEVFSFDEAMCCLFDDTGLGDRLQKGGAVFCKEADVLLCELEIKLVAINSSRPIMKIINDPKMEEVRVLAREILRLIEMES